MQSSPLTPRTTSSMTVIRRAYTRSLGSLSLVGSLLLVSLSVACNSIPGQSQGADKTKGAQEESSSAASATKSKSAAKTQEKTTAQATAQPQPNAKPAYSEDTFDVYTPAQGVSDVLLIKSKSGYKINENYPHRATFSLGEEALKAQVGLELKTLSFSIPDANLAKPGTSVKAGFSICDDKSCKVYNKNYNW